MILALIAVERLGSTELPDVPTGWNDVEALGAPTRYSVHVERYRFGTTDVRNPASYPILRDPVTREIVTFEESFPARVAPVWNTHNIGPQLGSHWANTVMHQPVGVGHVNVTALTEKVAADLDIARNWQPGNLKDDGKRSASEKGFHK